MQPPVFGMVRLGVRGLFAHERRFERERNCKWRTLAHLQRARKICWRNAYDRETKFIDFELLTDDVGIAAKAPLPVRMTDHYHGRGCHTVISFRDRAPQRWLDSETSKVIARDCLHLRNLGLLIHRDGLLIERRKGEETGQRTSLIVRLFSQ